MELLNRLIHVLIHGSSVQLRKYELACLRAMREALPTTARAVFNRQLEFLKSIHRHSKGKMLTFFPLRHEAVPESLLFADRAEERVVLVLAMAPRGAPRPILRAKVVLHRGALSSVEFQEQPSRLGFEKNTPVEVVRAHLTHDPTVVPTQEGRRLPYPDTWAGCLERLTSLGSIEGLQQPLEETSQTAILQSWGVKFPTDFLDILVQTDGVKVGSVRVNGLSELRSIVLPTYNLCVLAEVENEGVLCVIEDGSLFFLSNESDTPEPLMTSFCQALEGFLNSQAPISAERYGSRQP